MNTWFRRRGWLYSRQYWGLPMLETLLRRASSVVLPILLGACAVPFPVYTVSSANLTTIRAARNAVELGAFSGPQTSVSCRLQPISPEGGRTFAQYIRNAFNDELVIAGERPGLPRSRVSLQLKNIDVDCAAGTAAWVIEVDVTIANHRPFTVKTVRTFDGNLLGDVVLMRAYQAFVPSVQQLIADVMAHPTFRAEFGG